MSLVRFMVLVPQIARCLSRYQGRGQCHQQTHNSRQNSGKPESAISGQESVGTEDERHLTKQLARIEAVRFPVGALPLSLQPLPFDRQWLGRAAGAFSSTLNI